jgi:hypothetical protein
LGLIISCSMRCSILIFLLLCVTNAFAQGGGEDSLKIIEAKHDSIYHVEVLPLSALHGDYDLVIEGFEIITDSTRPMRGFRISWPGTFISGRNLMVINPRQIFLKTEHDNPYPDYLYWIIDIDTMQYRLISRNLFSHLNDKFDDHSNIYLDFYLLTYKDPAGELSLPDHWTDKEIRKHNMDYRNKLYMNLCRLLRMFNASLTRHGKEIRIPGRNEFIGIKPVRIVYSMEQYDDQLKTIIYK